MTPGNSIRFAAIAAVFFLSACSHRVPQATVEVIDTSASITPRAEKAALDAAESQIVHMQRGDTLVLIPITGDAQNDADGRILRLAAPVNREVYDADFRRFQATARKQFAVWVAALDPHQSRTDILGALDLARQELASLPKGMDRRLMLVSDFLEDDGTYRFASDSLLTNPKRARELARRLHEQHGFTLQRVPLCLGRLESSDFAPLAAHRKDAVEAFWTTYVSAGGEPAEIQFDGAGMLVDTEIPCAFTKR